MTPSPLKVQVSEPPVEPGDAAALPAAPASVASTRQRRRGRLPVVLSALLAAVVVAAAVVLALFWVKASNLDAADRTRADALSAAEQGAVNFTTYDYRHLDQDYDRVRETATGEFRKEFDQQSQVLSQVIKQSKAVAKGKVLASAVLASSSHDATVLVALDDTVTNTSVPQGVVRHYRLRVDMTRVKGRWLVSGVENVA